MLLHTVRKSTIHLLTAHFFPSDLWTEPQFLAEHTATCYKEYISQKPLCQKKTMRSILAGIIKLECFVWDSQNASETNRHISLSFSTACVVLAFNNDVYGGLDYWENSLLCPLIELDKSPVLGNLPLLWPNTWINQIKRRKHCLSWQSQRLQFTVV